MPSRIGDALYWHATYTADKIAVVSSWAIRLTRSYGPASAG
jgi:hypothetical protein